MNEFLEPILSRTMKYESYLVFFISSYGNWVNVKNRERVLHSLFLSLYPTRNTFDESVDTAWKYEHENLNFRLTKICEKGRKDHIFVSFRMFPFHGNIIFSELSLKRKCKKAVSFRKCVFLCKYETFLYHSWT